MGKAPKSTRKFASSGQLKKTIQSRKKHQQIKKKIQSRRGAKGKGKEKAIQDSDDDGEEDEIEESKGKGDTSLKGMSVDDFLGAGFMENDSDDEEQQPGSDDEEDDEDEDDIPDDQSFASIDDLEDEGDAHMLELSKLAEKDPEFYKYLQENDRELLEFDPHQMEDGDGDEDDGGEDEDVEMDTAQRPILTKDILRRWQKALLDHRSLRALRKLLLAFRSAVHMNEENEVLAWNIDSAAMYNKLITTALRFTPVVLVHHVPYKTLPNGKYKPPTQSQKQKALQKLVLSYFNNVIHLLPQLTDNELVQLALSESAKILPYVITSRKAVKAYLKRCLEFWSTGEDGVRIAALLAIRWLATSTDEAIMDLVLKSCYLELVRSSKSTSAYKLPSINLMKNSASEIFCLDHGTAYQHAFGYIRQLAIHLRNSMKTKTKEAYLQVYNWQYVHCVDFWALVLARACSTAAERGEESELQPLIYPVVQVSLGAIKLISNSRSYPFHLHIIRSMLHLSRHTKMYIPLSPYIIPIITSCLTASGKPKPSTLRPLNFETNIRAPAQYLKTRVYVEGLVEEATFILAEWLTSPTVHGSIAFSEVVVPIVVSLRKILKGAKVASKGGMGKEIGILKGLVERIEESAKWMEQKRKGVNFAPGKMSDVERWEAELKVEDSPLAKYVNVQRKGRTKRKNLVDKAAKGEDEFLDD